MTGIEKITARILSDAQSEVNATLAKAQAQADEITAGYQAQAEQEYADLTARGKADAEERELHLNSAAQMEVRKLVLAAKQEMLDKAYATALAQLNTLPDDAMTNLLAQLARKASTTGKEEVLLSASARKSVGQAVVAKANADGGLNLTLSDKAGAFDGGLVLSDGDVEVNCTFDTLVRLTRSETASEVAKVLFG